jgi:hypothetical protein
MAVDIEAVLVAIAEAERAFAAVREIADTIASALASAGQLELQRRLDALRAQNDADRARRHDKLAAAAAHGADG